MGYYITVLGPIIILALPIYFWGKYLERKIKPRESVQRFLAWVGVILSSCIAYYILCVFVFLKFFLVKHNA